MPGFAIFLQTSSRFHLRVQIEAFAMFVFILNREWSEEYLQKRSVLAISQCDEEDRKMLPNFRLCMQHEDRPVVI